VSRKTTIETFMHNLLFVFIRYNNIFTYSKKAFKIKQYGNKHLPYYRINNGFFYKLDTIEQIERRSELCTDYSNFVSRNLVLDETDISNLFHNDLNISKLTLQIKKT
jgi:hypothetical protein